MIRSTIQIGAIALMALAFASVGASASTARSERSSAGIRAVQGDATERVQVAVVCRYVVRAGRRTRVCT